jgi:poly [ADP-ribose] polymerase
MNAVSGQNSILDALQASLDTILSGHDDKNKKDDAKKEEKVFNVKLKLNEDQGVFQKVRALYQKTRQATHSCHHLDVVKVYDVSIAHMEEAFEKHAIKMSNIWQLWHGTQASNILSILSKGMIIPPANAAHCTGRMYGNGIYASDQSTKALNYAYGYWGGSSDPNCFMFLIDMAMGKYYIAPGPFSGGPPQGYDSTFAKAGQSSVINNEMIAYDTRQVRIKKLVEFAPGGSR